MNAEELAEWLTAHLPRYITEIPLDPLCLEVRHVLNWGGFVNHSFSVNDGSARYHLKLTNDSKGRTRLQGWRDVHQILERRYRSPELIAWVELTEIGFAGLLMRHVESKTADLCRNPDLVQQLIRLAGCLHEDAEIRSHLERSGPAKTYFDYFVATYIDRFTSDLKAIGADPPPFIPPALFAWMQDQTGELRDQANRVQAFHHPAVEPTHGDLNEGNVLVAPDGWFIVDWDDLALGDPAIEFAVLLWPMIYEGRQWQEFLRPDAKSGFAERMQVCLRAQLLDEVIDNVADYVEAPVVPSKQTRVQLLKKKRHEEALDRYIRIQSEEAE